MSAAQNIKQGESQLVGEWIATLPRAWKIKTHVHVGKSALNPDPAVTFPGIAKYLENWNNWADVRIFTGSEIWIVEASIVGRGSKYGQVMEYAAQYPDSLDAQSYPLYPVVPIVLCAFEKPAAAIFFARYGVRTIVYTPSWAASGLQRIATPGDQAISPGV